MALRGSLHFHRSECARSRSESVGRLSATARGCRTAATRGVEPRPSRKAETERACVTTEVRPGSHNCSKYNRGAAHPASPRDGRLSRNTPGYYGTPPPLSRSTSQRSSERFFLFYPYHAPVSLECRRYSIVYIYRPCDDCDRADNKKKTRLKRQTSKQQG